MSDPKKDDKKALTGEALIKAAAKFVGVKEADVFHAVDKGDGRFAVVTLNGQKLSQTPDECAAAEKAEAAAAAARQAARDARAQRRAGK